ncbi:unnamed protein product [Onchocerca ochengi]|uniref:Methyltransferase n=1 Tax=Onchocerca ochengi TaxID=42157 RepID=A0A182EM41_ONCOC|nr:unnamed protein product [Onchocerca ochengi]
MAFETNMIVGPDKLESNFDSQSYLWDFYQHIDDPAMQMMIMLLPIIAERIDCYDSLLDFGAGPTIHVSVVFRNKIYLADYLPQNRNELLRWTTGQSLFDWTPVLKMIASVEGSGWLHLKEMEQYTKSKIVVSIFCLEYCSNSEMEYKEAVRNVADQVKPGGGI